MKRGSLDIVPLMFFLFALTVLMFSVLLSFSTNAQQDSNATIHNVTIQLAKDKYTKGQLIDGKLLLRLTNSTNPNTIVTLRLPGMVRKIGLLDLIANSSMNYTITPGRFEGINPATSKTLLIVEGQPKTVGVIVPAFAEVQSFDMSVSATLENQLRTPNMDIGLDKEIDWYYLGNFVTWNLPVKPAGLVETAGDKVIINNGGESATVYCQRMQLPFSKDFNVSVSYKSLNNAGDLKTVIYSVSGDPAFPSGGANLCDLLEDTISEYHSCTIRFPSAEKGDHLVCVYNDGNITGDSYELNADTSRETSTAFACQRTDPVFCEPATTTNYFIKVAGANYSELLNSDVNFAEWSLGIDSALNALKKEVGSTPFVGNCAPGLCLVPIEISGSGSGSLTLRNLGIRYETGGAARTTSQTDKLYEVIKRTDTLESVKGQSLLEPRNIEILLSLFNMTADAPRQGGAISALQSLQAGFGNDLEASQAITVFFDNVPAEGSQLMLNSIQDSFNALPQDDDTKLMLELSGLNKKITSAASSIASFQPRASAGDSPELQNEITTFRASLPSSIVPKGSVADIQLIEPGDITKDISDNNEELYFQQDDASVTAKIKNYEVTDFSGNVKNYALITKQVKAKKNLDKVDVFEVISKNAASSLDTIKFQETPKIVNEDPIVKWYLASLKSGQTKEYRYVVEESALNIDYFKTIIAPAQQASCGNGKCDADEDEQSCPGDCKPLSKCGDGVCTEILEDEASCPKDCKKSFPWLYVAAGIIIVIGWAALYFLKGRKKLPFKNEQELEQLVNYIKVAKKKKVKDSEIEKGLMERGWTKEQVDYAFVEVLSKTDVKPMRDYIQKSIAKNVAAATIRQKLISQGWDEKLVDIELKPYSK